MWKEEVVAYFKVLFRHMLGGITKGKQRKTLVRIADLRAEI
jgi:hypothetical protein